jgi:ComF family protein
VPVPLHNIRRRERGYNQSELLARVISGQTGIPCLAKGLVRRKYTEAQATLGKEDRLQNIRGAFSVKRNHMFDGKNIILIDDVVTTGATVNECAGVLSDAGATQVLCLTAARTLRKLNDQ